ncbi:sensor histidine kinase [Saccharopolyspora phatthalungensis]|uniref:histidine kinase n=1 Tax=Saccharopolyspora phatthalungensis TaxID=664693 RepID=A0A840Q1W3_9PSEU|nr:sensor histidine kinase [Saccharopolyspora phatthalungensis]MBB5154394.1 signal transduction histidine kinase [Saccharopolyspora phatthalungensis]
MRKLSLWLRARPLVGDSGIATFILLVHLGELSGDGERSRGMPIALHVVAGLLLTVPLAVRRIWPVRSAYVALLGVAIMSVAHHGSDFATATVVACLMIYTLVACTGRRTAALYTALTGGFFLLRLFTDRELPADLTGLIFIQLGFFVLLAGFCWVLGEFIGARRAYHAEVERRLHSLEFERDQQARIAVAEERNRIAREIHDVLAHSVSVMVTQADGAGYALHRNPELAERALQAIGSTGREALGELRSLLGVLRDTAEPDPGRIPQPTGANLNELIDRVRGLGHSVSLELTGDFTALPTGIGLSAYRIVQEALTNVVKHGGAGTTAAVRANNDGQHIEIEVVDDGMRPKPTGRTSGGNGLIGMRERAVIYGGTLEAGPCAEGGWRVRAVLPLDMASANSAL